MQLGHRAWTECQKLRFVSLMNRDLFLASPPGILPSACRVTGLSLNSWLVGGRGRLFPVIDSQHGCHSCPKSTQFCGWMVPEQMGLLGRQGSAVGLSWTWGPEGLGGPAPGHSRFQFKFYPENIYGNSPLWYKFEYMSVFRKFLKNLKQPNTAITMCHNNKTISRRKWEFEFRFNFCKEEYVV